MQELHIDLPVKINGVFITNDVINQLDFLQSGGTSDAETPVFDNSGANDYKQTIDELTDYLLSVLVDKDNSEGYDTEVNLLQNLYWVKNLLNSFRSPETKE